MMIQLCTCDKYPDAHDHVQSYYAGIWDENTVYHFFLKRPDGSEAQVGDVIRIVNWQREAEKLAAVLYEQQSDADFYGGGHRALKRWWKVEREANQVVVAVEKVSETA